MTIRFVFCLFVVCIFVCLFFPDPVEYRCHLQMGGTREGIILIGIQKGINSPTLDMLRLKYRIEIEQGTWGPK